MNIIRTITIAALSLSAGAANAKTSVLVLPPSYADSKDALAEVIGNYAMQLRGADRLIVYDGDTLQQIASIEQPTGPNATNPAWVKRHLAMELGPVVQFINDLPTTAGNGGPVANIRVPAMLDEIGRNLVPSLPEKKADVLLVGSFLYDDPRNPFFSMRNGTYPLDADMTRSESQIPYGLAGLEKRLEGTTVHWCGANGQGEFVTAEYETSVKRWWTLWLDRQSARVGTFSYDLPTCFARLQSGQASGQIAYKSSGNPTVGMVQYTILGETPSFGLPTPASTGSELAARPVLPAYGSRPGPVGYAPRGSLVPRPTPPAPQSGGRGNTVIMPWNGN